MYPKVLLIDDDEEVHFLVKRALGSLINVVCVKTGQEAVATLREQSFPVVIIDIYLENECGLELLPVVKEQNRQPCAFYLVLTGQGTPQNQVEAHQQDIDEFITKPFEMEVLRVIVEKFIKRAKEKESNILSDKSLELDLLRMRCLVLPERKDVQLTPKEFKLLATLFQAPERVFDREKLYDMVWSDASSSTFRTVDMHISSLRKKLGPKGRLIKTVHSLGYKYVP